MRVIVCGGRDYLDTRHIHAKLDLFHAKHPITLLIEGGARGADIRARAWAIARRVPFVTYEADWLTYDKRAGIFRNFEMLHDGKAEAVIAFPGGRGTADMIRQAEKAGVPVWRVRPA